MVWRSNLINVWLEGDIQRVFLAFMHISTSLPHQVQELNRDKGEQRKGKQTRCYTHSGQGNSGREKLTG